VTKQNAGERVAEAVWESLEPPTPHLRNPFTLLSEHVSRGRFLDAPQALSTRPKRLRVALVSLRRFEADDFTFESFSTLQEILKEQEGIDLEACMRRLVRLSRSSERVLRQRYLDGLRVALEDLQAQIVLVNELGFPALKMSPRVATLRETKRLADRHQALIIAGSCHDHRTLYNTCSIFYPGSPPLGSAYHKQVSALQAREIVSIPTVRETRVIRAFGLWIAVLICLDIADFSAVSAVVNCSDRADLLLVPCYSKKMETLTEIARATSRAMGQVALCNYYTDSDEVSNRSMTRFGKDIRPRKVMNLNNDDGEVALYEFDPASIENQKLDRRKTADARERMEWLFGTRVHRV